MIGPCFTTVEPHDDGTVPNLHVMIFESKLRFSQIRKEAKICTTAHSVLYVREYGWAGVTVQGVSCGVHAIREDSQI